MMTQLSQHSVEYHQVAGRQNKQYYNQKQLNYINNPVVVNSDL